MTDTNESAPPEKKVESQDITRREALAKLAKYSAYTAPTVLTLLASRPSMAQLSSVNQCTGINNRTGDPDPPPQTGQPFDGIETGDHMRDISFATDMVVGDTDSMASADVKGDTSANADAIRTNDTVIDCGR